MTNKKYLKLTTLLFAVLFLSTNIKSQAPTELKLVSESNLIMIGKNKGEINLIRWAPRNYAIWQQLNSSGYILERYELKEHIVDWSTKIQITDSVFKPKSIEEFKASYKPENNLAAIAVQSIYGETAAIEDTDGSQFSGIASQHLQQSNLHGFGMLVADASMDIAESMALGFVDDSISNEKDYAYKLYAAPGQHDEAVDTAWIVLKRGKGIAVPQVNSLTAEQGEKRVKLIWSAAENINPPSGYFIEQSLDNGITWNRLNDMPHISISNSTDSLKAINDLEVSFTVKLDTNYQALKYRVKAFNAFGELSTECNIISAHGIDQTAPPSPRIKNPQELNNAMILSWTMPEDTEPLQGFMVGHSERAQGPFFAINDQLIDPSIRTWADEKANERTQHYYIISAIDTAGNISNSLPVYSKFIDSIPPEKPIGLHGSIDTNGVMVFSWDPNKEDDLLGYNVWFSNQEDHEFIQINSEPMNDTSFTQVLELETLTEEIFYQVVALDINFNPSKRSDILKLKKPDIIAPVAPQIHEITVSNKSVHIKWHNSPSKDIYSHQLFRKKATSNEWQLIMDTLNLEVIDYTDFNAEVNENYHYYIQGTDDDGLVSKASNQVSARVYQTTILDAITDLKIEKLMVDNKLKITWQEPQGSDYRIYLYKASGDSPLSLIKSIKPNTLEFVDSQITGDNNYQYGIKVMYDSGSTSQMIKSEAVSF